MSNILCKECPYEKEFYGKFLQKIRIYLYPPHTLKSGLGRSGKYEKERKENKCPFRLGAHCQSKFMLGTRHDKRRLRAVLLRQGLGSSLGKMNPKHNPPLPKCTCQTRFFLFVPVTPFYLKIRLILSIHFLRGLLTHLIPISSPKYTLHHLILTHSFHVLITLTFFLCSHYLVSFANTNQFLFFNFSKVIFL